MKNLKDDTFVSRRNAAADAKAALLKAHRAAADAADSMRTERQEDRLSVATARAVRQGERARGKLEEQKVAQAAADTEKDATEAAARTEVETQETLSKDHSAREAQKSAADKARRDERYANRKSRQR
jgi:Family of unknown function (DUF6481)